MRRPVILSLLPALAVVLFLCFVKLSQAPLSGGDLSTGQIQEDSPPDDEPRSPEQLRLIIRSVAEQIADRQPLFQPLFIYDEREALLGRLKPIGDAAVSVTYAGQPLVGGLLSDTDGLVSLDDLPGVPEGALIWVQVRAEGYGARYVPHHYHRFIPHDRLVGTAMRAIGAIGLYPAETVLRGRVAYPDRVSSMQVEISRWQEEFCWPLSVDRLPDGTVDFELPVWELVLPDGDAIDDGSKQLTLRAERPLDLELCATQIADQHRVLSAAVDIWNLPRKRTTDLETLLGEIRQDQFSVRVELKDGSEPCREGTLVTIHLIRGVERFDSFKLLSKEGVVDLSSSSSELRFDDAGELSQVNSNKSPRIRLSLVRRGRSIEMPLPNLPTPLPIPLEDEGVNIGECQVSIDSEGRTAVVARLVL